MNFEKVYVPMTILVDVDGNIRPVSFTWEDGRVFSIDRLIDRRPAASTKVGGEGMRYTVRIGALERYIYHEEGRWFVEGIAKTGVS